MCLCVCETVIYTQISPFSLQMCATEISSSTWSEMHNNCLKMKFSGRFQHIIDHFQEVIKICSAKGFELDINFTVCRMDDLNVVILNKNQRICKILMLKMNQSIHFLLIIFKYLLFKLPLITTKDVVYAADC